MPCMDYSTQYGRKKVSLRGLSSNCPRKGISQVVGTGEVSPPCTLWPRCGAES